MQFIKYKRKYTNKPTQKNYSLKKKEEKPVYYYILVVNIHTNLCIYAPHYCRSRECKKMATVHHHHQHNKIDNNFNAFTKLTTTNASQQTRFVAGRDTEYFYMCKDEEMFSYV